MRLEQIMELGPFALIGYTIEKSHDPRITRAFLRNVWGYHTEHNIPATFFLLGKSIEENHGDLQPFAESGLFDFAQHTYSHVAFKDIDEKRADGQRNYLPGAPLDMVEEEIARTNSLISARFSLECSGVEGARGYYLGIQDRPDIAEALIGNNLRYCVTYCRNENGWNPVELAAQPYWHTLEGKGEILEIPNQGWQDAAYIKEYGAASVGDYYCFCETLAQSAAKGEMAVSFIMHDWTNLQWDPAFSHTIALYERIKSMGMPMLNFKQYFDIQYESRQRRQASNRPQQTRRTVKN